MHIRTQIDECEIYLNLQLGYSAFRNAHRHLREWKVSSCTCYQRMELQTFFKDISKQFCIS